MMLKRNIFRAGRCLGAILVLQLPLASSLAAQAPRVSVAPVVRKSLRQPVEQAAILLPYAFKRSLSSYSNEVVLVFKSTSLAYTITLMEVMGYSQLLYGRTYDVMVFGAAGIIYLVVNGLLTLMMRLIERKALAFERRN